ncbi:MAG: M20/M25/M40 family metallo-hydrolase [Acidobacteria bacterium]|nr:M20/M25/M40 family metallo-hydrolase [Acidobacteriota bacterium]
MRLACLLFSVALLTAQERIDADAIAKIRQEALERSQVMQTLQVLTDRYGPRLTGSPNYEAAARWAAARMTEWGLKNAKLEPWEFGHPGWLNERASGHFVAPVKDNLVFEVLGWTPSTNGATAARAVLLEPPASPTADELQKWMDSNRDLVQGRIVMVGKPVVVPVSFATVNKRMDDEAVRKRLEGGGPGGPQRPQAAKPEPGKLTAAQVTALIDPWLVANGALVKVTDAGMVHGMVRAFQNRTYDVTKTVPTAILRNEDYGRAARLLARGEQVVMEFNIVNRVYPEGNTTWNVVAEIPGTDKKDEVVMLGGHLDSWHSATGATDNASGVSVMMEAARIIQALGLKPRRTIRVGLWSAEEQGLLGSKAYVKEHFGTFEEPKPEFGKLVGYLNVDSGTGRIRGASVFGPPEAADVLKAALKPFEDLGVMGAAASKSRREGGTDSTSFSAAGLPGIGLMQDPIEYFGITWHTNLDTYERIVPDDVMKASAVVATAVWHLANRDEMLPRFTKDQMPAPVKPEPPPERQ